MTREGKVCKKGSVCPRVEEQASSQMVRQFKKYFITEKVMKMSRRREINYFKFL